MVTDKDTKQTISDLASSYNFMNSFVSSFVSSFTTYHSTFSQLDEKETDSNEFLVNLWFGATSSVNLGSGNPEATRTFPFPTYTNIYGQNQWLQHGVAQFAPGYNQADPYSLTDSNSLLNKYLNKALDKNDDDYAIADEGDNAAIVKTLNSLNDVQKLVFFGENPDAVLGTTGVTPPKITFSDLNTSKQIEEFRKAINIINIQNPTSDRSVGTEFIDQTTPKN